MEVRKEKEESEEIMSTNLGHTLPPHISAVIFSKFPISKLGVSRLVCKSWNNLVLDYTSSHSKFFPKTFIFSTGVYDTELHLFYYPKIHHLDCNSLTSSFEFDFPDDYVCVVSIENYCNGLLFVFKYTQCGTKGFCKGILNPMTTEFFAIPISNDISMHGFGYGPKTKQYKLFAFMKKDNDRKIEIFDFGRGGSNNHNQWRSVWLPFRVDICSNGTYLDGVVYWIGKSKKENENVIYAMDVETENFEIIGVLDVGPYSWRTKLQSLNGTLYAIVSLYTGGICPPCPQIQLWRMEKKDSWIHTCTFQPFLPTKNVRYCPSICLLKTSEDGAIWFLKGNDIFYLDMSGKMIIIETLFRNDDTHVQSACPIEFLHLDSLSNILRGDEVLATKPTPPFILFKIGSMQTLYFVLFWFGLFVLSTLSV